MNLLIMHKGRDARREKWIILEEAEYLSSVMSSPSPFLAA